MECKTGAACRQTDWVLSTYWTQEWKWATQGADWERSSWVWGAAWGAAQARADWTSGEVWERTA